MRAGAGWQVRPLRHPEHHALTFTCCWEIVRKAGWADERGAGPGGVERTCLPVPAAVSSGKENGSGPGSGGFPAHSHCPTSALFFTSETAVLSPFETRGQWPYRLACSNGCVILFFGLYCFRITYLL